MKAIVYTRVSTDKQASDGDSLALQQSKAECYCELHDLELVDTYTDAGATGRTMDRPGLQSALDALDDGEADCLVIYKLDRLTRSTSDLCDLLKRFDEDDGPDLKSVSESIDTATAAGRMVIKMLGVVSEWGCEVIAERTAEAMGGKKGRGEYTGGQVPYGQQLASDGVHLEPNPKEIEIRGRIRHLRDQGLSLRAIAGELNDRDVPRRNGNRWNAKAVSTVLEAV